jgi:hypothetical protein
MRSKGNKNKRNESARFLRQCDFFQESDILLYLFSFLKKTFLLTNFYGQV